MCFILAGKLNGVHEMITLTLNQIREKDPCKKSWLRLLASMDKTKADDTPIGLDYILDLLGMNDALWAIRCLPSEMSGKIRLLACDFAEPALKYTDDPRPAEAIRIARLHAVGQATDSELAAAGDAAWYAARDAARSAAGDAARAAATEQQKKILRAWIMEYTK